MQIIRSVLKIESGAGQWVNDSGSGAVTPSFLLGVQAKLVLDLRSPLSDDAEEATLPPYPPEELEGLSFIFAMDLDYDAATPCKFIKNSGITMGVDPLGRLLCTIPLPNTDTETMREALSTAPMLTFNCELIARNAEDADVFAVQFPMTVLNRILLGEATPSPDTESPEWLPTVSSIIRQVVEENAESLKGKPGDPGAPGAPGKSAYDTWKAQDGNGDKTEQEFLDALKGKTGDPGEKGADASVKIGTVETVDSPEEASAEIVGGVLNLKIPKGQKGDKGASMLFSFAATASANLPDWHAHCLPTDHYWRVSEDGGATWTSPRPLQAPAIAPVARFSQTPQVTNPVWTSPEQKEEFVELPASSAYFRVRMSGYPWTEPRLISAPNGIDTMPEDEVAAQEATLKAATIRAQFSADGQEGSWHAAIEEGDLYVKFFSTNGAVSAIWNLSAFGAEHSLEALQASPTGPQWHDNPLPGDKYMKISLDGGETWYSNCFVIAAEQVEGGTASPGTSQAEWGGIGGALSDQSDLKNALDAKAEKSAVDAHVADTSIHVTSDEKAAWDAKAAGDHNHDGTYIPVTGCPLTNFSVEGKRADGSSIGTRIRYTVEDRTDQPVDNLFIKTQRLYLHSNEVAFNARPLLAGRTHSQAGGFVISDYNTGDIKSPGEFIEGDTKLSDKYAAKSHKHAMGDITGLPASGGTAGQVLTKTATGSEWADAASSGTSGEGGTDAGAVRYVRSYDDYLEVCDLAKEQEIHHSALFMAASDISGDFLEIRKSMDGDVVDDTLRKGHAYLRVDFSGGSSSTLQERTVSTSTYVVKKVKFVSRDGSAGSQTYDLLSGREDAHYLFPDSFDKASASQYGFTFKDREPAADAALNEGWPTVAVDISKRISAYKEELEREGTYIGSTPWYLADTNVGITNSGPVFKKSGGAWLMGSVYCDPSLKFSESFDENTKFDMVFLFKDSSGSYVETPTPNATETTTEDNGRYGVGVVAATIDITPDPLRLAIQALEGAALEVSPGKAYSATLSADATLSATGGEEGYRQEAFLDVNPGAFTLTPGSGISFAQDLTANKLNHCRIIWTGTSARLLVDDVTDAPASGGSGGSGEETGGSESGGSSDAFPTTFTVTACSGNEAAKGEYTRTGETTTVGGTDYPVYSYTQPVLATAFYIYVCQYRQGSSGAFWSLKDGSYAASDEGYSGLGSVAVDTSTGLPMDKNWSASGKQATVTWA